MTSFLFVAGSTRCAAHEDEAATWGRDVIRIAMEALSPGDVIVTSAARGPETWAVEAAKARGVVRTVLHLHSGDRHDNERFSKHWWSGWKDTNDWSFTTQRERHKYRNDTMVAYAEAARSAAHAVNFLVVTRDKYDFDIEYASDLVLKASSSGFLVSEAEYASRQLRPDIVWIDTETGGFGIDKNPLLEIGAVRSDYTGCKLIDTFETRLAVPQGMYVDARAALVCSYNPFKWATAPPEPEAVKKFVDWLPKRFIFGGYNHYITVRQRLPMPGWIDALDLMPKVKEYQRYTDKMPNAKLESACDYFGIYNEVRHKALIDAERTRLLYLKMTGKTPQGSILPQTANSGAMVVP